MQAGEDFSPKESCEELLKIGFGSDVAFRTKRKYDTTAAPAWGVPESFSEGKWPQKIADAAKHLLEVQERQSADKRFHAQMKKPKPPLCVSARFRFRLVTQGL